MTTEQTVSVSKPPEKEDTLQAIFVRCAVAILASKQIHVTSEAMDYLIALAETHMQQLFATLHRITEIQRRKEPSVADIGIWLSQQELALSCLENEMKLSSKYTEDLNHLKLDPNPQQMSDDEQCFFIEPSMAIKNVVPSHSRLNGWLPSWMPQLPPDHTFMSTAEYTQRVTDPRELRERIVEEGRRAEEALQRLIGLRRDGDDDLDQDDDDEEESEANDLHNEEGQIETQNEDNEDISMADDFEKQSESKSQSHLDSDSESDVEPVPKPVPSLKISFSKPKVPVASDSDSEDESMMESVMVPVADPIDKSVGEPTVDPVVEPTVDSVIEPTVEVVADSMVEPKTETPSNGPEEGVNLPKISLTIKPLKELETEADDPEGNGVVESVPSENVLSDVVPVESAPSDNTPQDIILSKNAKENSPQETVSQATISLVPVEASSTISEDYTDVSKPLNELSNEPLREPLSGAQPSTDRNLPSAPHEHMLHEHLFNEPQATSVETNHDSSASPLTIVPTEENSHSPVPKITLKPVKIRLSLGGQKKTEQLKEESESEVKQESQEELEASVKAVQDSLDPFRLYRPMEKPFDVVEYARKRRAIVAKKESDDAASTAANPDSNIETTESTGVLATTTPTPASSATDVTGTTHNSNMFDLVFENALKSISKSRIVKELDSAAINWNAERFVK